MCHIGWLNWLVNWSLPKGCDLLRSCTWIGYAKASTEPRRGPQIMILLVTICSQWLLQSSIFIIRFLSAWLNVVFTFKPTCLSIRFVRCRWTWNGVCALHMFLRRAMLKQVLNDGWTNLAVAKMVHRKMTVMISKCAHHLILFNITHTYEFWS